VVTLEPVKGDAEEVALYAIDAGAEDVKIEKGYIEVHTKPEDLETVRRALEEKGVTIISAEVSQLPRTTVQLDEKTALQALKLLDRLEELDDVQRVFSNVDFSDEVLEKLRAQA
jgi:transcriptional/translational regulatory protein YebC/TACO1